MVSPCGRAVSLGGFATRRYSFGASHAKSQAIAQWEFVLIFAALVRGMSRGKRLVMPC